MSIRLVLSESRATVMLMGPAFAGRKGRKKKMRKEKDGRAEGKGEEGMAKRYATRTREWMCSHYTLCSFNFFKEPNPARHLEYPR